MPPTRLQRSAATLEDVREAVRAEFGPGARIVAAERVTSGGIGGLFRKAHVEATVEVHDATDVPTARVAIADGPAKRVGIAALLADAEETEARIAASSGTSATRADAFASVLDGFVADGIAPAVPAAAAAAAATAPGPGAGPDRSVEGDPGLLSDAPFRSGGTAGVDDVTSPRAFGASAAARTPVPAVLSADGDLVVLVGRAGDVDAAAGVFAARHGLRETDAADRRGGILARADGVRLGHALLGVATWDDARTLDGLAPDQVWVVVDAGRKHEDSLAMVDAVASVVAVAGVLSIGGSETASPESVHGLGLPVRTL
ncbi:hypothetical protein EDF24_2884 [Curtobacterium sp. PhB130]|uniref:hypothetical protein n=1 Tax=unclassified Curtobacterium TaxID=257496 RepID=UPI000F4B5523|nr:MULTISPECIES: hypothetical protein [unclassified Curtobacterium]ROP66072.1 hypothetical protein EDF55_0518 [Curtobacterium sp. ZW137]ROS73877.1 hypothetical protein EDF24_2884 [Curtobacterium sp. PhB130]